MNARKQPGPTDDNQREPARIAACVLAGWLVPGAGHFTAGFRRHGVILFFLLATAFGIGLLLSDMEATSRSLHPYAFWAESGVGLTAAFLVSDPGIEKLLPGSDSVRTYTSVPRYVDSGVLFCAVAGLLNLLVLFDLVERMLGGPMARENR